MVDTNSLFAEKRLLIIQATGGLASRIRALVSCQYLAQRAGREPVLIWEPDDHCPAPFSALYENRVLQLDSLDALPTERSRVHFRAGEHNKSRLDIYNQSAEVVVATFGGYIFDRADIDLTVYDHLEPEEQVDKELEAYHQFALGTLRPYLKALIPQQAIQNQVEQFAQTWFQTDTHGVHVRRTDHRPARRRSKLKQFFSKMDRMLDERPETTFFLATDNQKSNNRCERLFINRYGPARIFCFPKHFAPSSDRRHTPVELALVDLLLLSRTRSVLGSYRSSFSRVAAILSDIPHDEAV